MGRLFPGPAQALWQEGCITFPLLAGGESQTVEQMLIKGAQISELGISVQGEWGFDSLYTEGPCLAQCHQGCNPTLALSFGAPVLEY